MDYDLYFTILKQDPQDCDGPYREWEQLEEANHGPGLQTDCLPICIEESLSEYILSLNPGRPRIQMEEELNNPLPAIPEEPKAYSRSMLDGHNAIYQRESTVKSLPEPSRCSKAIDESHDFLLQRRPRAGKIRPVGIINPPTSTAQKAAVKHPHTTRTDWNLSLRPKPHASDIHKGSRTSAIIQQRHIDSAYNPDFDSLHSEESCDLDRWASEIYGNQDVTMTSLRNKRCAVSPRIASTECSVEPMPIANIHKTNKLYADSAYCSSTSTGSYTDRDRTSSNSMSELLAEYAEQWRLQDTKATSFFGSDDDDIKSKCASEKRPPAKTLWRKMLGLRSAQGKFPGPQTRNSGPPVDVPIVLT